MAYPDLYKDETKILEAQNIKVKSVSFTAVLTSRRLILIDSKKQSLPPQEILLATLKNVDSGENAIRDPTITVSIITNTGTTRQMILTFSKTSGGDRKRECDEWIRALRLQVSQTVQHHPIIPDIKIPAQDEHNTIPENVPATPSNPRIEIVNAPPQKKRIEISRPMKKIIESVPAMPKPVETSSLPTGTFCNRCGSRMPADSVFCNRCGTPVAKDSDLVTASHQPSPVQPVPYPLTPASAIPQVAVPVPPTFGLAADKKEDPLEQVLHSVEPLDDDSDLWTVPEPVNAIKPVETARLAGSFCNRCGNHVPAESGFCNKCGTPVVKESDLAAVSSQTLPHPEIPASTVPQVAVPIPPTFGLAADKKERPIEEVIHSIEPLIEGSVPRTQPAPLIPRPVSHQVPEPVVSPAESPASEIQWPVITSSAGTPETLAPVPDKIPQLVPSGSSGRGKTIAIAILAIVILAAIAGVFIFANPLQMIGGDTTVVPTPVPTTVAVVTTLPVTTTVPVATMATPEITTVPAIASPGAIPQTGVWVRVNYANRFAGTLGTPNSLRDVSDTGEKFYQVSTSTGTVAVSLQKVDGSADELTVEIYKDGELIRKKSTVAPKGLIELQESMKPAVTPAPTLELITAAPTATSTLAANSTANATASNG